METCPYEVSESVGFWLVKAPDGRTLARCPSREIADEIAVALWESQKRRQEGA
jgi:hypothetical protein